MKTHNIFRLAALVAASLVSAHPIAALDGSDLWLTHRANNKAGVTVDAYHHNPIIDKCVEELKTYSTHHNVRLNLADKALLPPQSYSIVTLAPGEVQISAPDAVGLLYGTYALLRSESLDRNPDGVSAPKIERRILNHWDNLDGTIERGYAGHSLWQWDSLPGVVSPRYDEYARACASVGINGTVLNNVNAGSKILSAEYLPKVAALADVMRPYGLRVYLSVNFASPIQLGGLPTADPLDKNVAEWWKDKANEIYSLIPDFGGFLVKANSEGQPGPCDYGRTHADGANMLADALAPHDGVVMWRSFVYSPDDADRAKQAYNEFVPLDGKFASNVIVQIKNGPIDFQPREPYSPLFGAMPNTPEMAEVQITQEYLGHANHLAYLAPMWEEFFDYVDCSRHKAIAGVANIGDDKNWTGNPMAQANWYAFGRMAWDPALSSGDIADEWVRQSGFVTDEASVVPVVDMMLGSREAVVNYMMPMGLHHLFAFGHHYGPEPWCDVAGARADWLPKYYHRADKDGIGFDRTLSGSNAVGQYPEPYRSRFGNLDECPEEFLLWFHHVPWAHKLDSGETVWEALCRHYDTGVKQAQDMEILWSRLNIDPEYKSDVKERLRAQAKDARWWRDACLMYFSDINGLPIKSDEIPRHSLKEYKSIDLGITNYESPSPALLDAKR